MLPGGSRAGFRGFKFEDPRCGLPDLVRGPVMVVSLLLSKDYSPAEEKALPQTRFPPFVNHIFCGAEVSVVHVVQTNRRIGKVSCEGLQLGGSPRPPEGVALSVGKGGWAGVGGKAAWRRSYWRPPGGREVEELGSCWELLCLSFGASRETWAG